jgi:IstB-like ATP binding protein
MTPTDPTRLDVQLRHLQMRYIQSHYQDLATKAAEQQRSHLDYLEQLVEGEATERENRSIARRIKNARFPVLKSLDEFQWSWPQKINRPQIQKPVPSGLHRNPHQCRPDRQCRSWQNPLVDRMHFVERLGRAACLDGHAVLFTTAVDIINTLAAAQSAGKLKPAFQRYLKPELLIVDELGYLPIDKARRRLAVPDHQPALRARAHRDHHQPRLQALVADLQQRQHLDLRHPGSRPAPRRNRHHRRQELPHERRDRRVNGQIAPIRSRHCSRRRQRRRMMERARQSQVTHFTKNPPSPPIQHYQSSTSEPDDRLGSSTTSANPRRFDRDVALNAASDRMRMR